MYELSALGLWSIGLGLIAGSFLNALSFRFNTGRSIAHGRSMCMRCGHTLRALDLIPLFSYVFLLGTCRYCGTRISMQYPLVELAAAMLSFGVFTAVQTPLMYAFWFFVWMVILFIVIYDIRHTVIPWSCSLLLIGLSLVSLFLSGMPSFAALLSGPLLALPLLALSFFSRGRWMGWGDGVFQLSLGWFLGLVPALSALALSVWTGAFVGVGLVLVSQLPWKYRSRGFTIQSELPFAPFLALGALLVYFFHVDLFSTYFLLW